MAKETKVDRTGSQAARILFLLGLIIFIGGGWVWWRNVASSSENVFYSMIENNMRTRSLGRHILQDNGSQKLEQRAQVTTGQTALASSLTTLSQGAGTTVKTQSIGMPYEDYVRYISIETDQTNANGEKLNFDQVIGVWGKSGDAAQGGETNGELFGENILGVIPVGFVPHDKRQELMRLIEEKNIYKTDFSKAKSETVDGRPRYTYDVSVASEDYITMLKQFAKAVGLTQLESLDPAAFSDAEPFQFSMAVDIWSRQLLNITFAANSRTETYSSYGQESSYTKPEQAISVDELQSRLQNTQ